jgi:DNA-binding LacI/PurR family transcriptional regulator
MLNELIEKRKKDLSFSKIIESITEYLSTFKYERIILHVSNEPWVKKIVTKVKDTCSKTKQKLMIHYCHSDPWGYSAIEDLNSILKKIQ